MNRKIHITYLLLLMQETSRIAETNRIGNKDTIKIFNPIYMEKDQLLGLIMALFQGIISEINMFLHFLNLLMIAD